LKTATYIANRLFLLLNRRRYRTFLKKAPDLAERQARLLLDLLKANQDTDFGRTHAFSQIHDIETFRKNVPITDYSDYQADIARLMAGQTNVLTHDPVTILVPTSGTSSASKYIPYNRLLRNDFAKQVNVWIYDLLRHHPNLRHGKQFWIVSPVVKPQYPESRLPIGFEVDSSYLGRLGRLLVRQVLLVPDDIAHFHDTENYHFTLSALLLSEKNLGLLSLWNPSLLNAMLQYIRTHFTELVEVLRAGPVQLPRPSDHDLQLAKKIIRKNPTRAAELQRLGPDWTALWPNLQVISCWTEAWAAIYLDELHRNFPNVTCQGKGLLATEGIVSIPLTGATHPVLTYDSHFYEFRDPTTQTLFLAHELEPDHDYEVILTTHGGLYRYNLHDLVRVKGFHHHLPMLEFKGRTNRISDYTGEKLSETAVTEILDHLLQPYVQTDATYFLKAVTETTPTHYGLYIDASLLNPNFTPETLLADLETELCRNIHYDNSRQLHQLGEPRLYLLTAAELSTFLTKSDGPASTRKTQRLIL
jgi:hypothetical protein